MTPTWIALLPMLCVAAASIVVLMQLSIRRNHGLAVVLTCLGLIGALAAIIPAAAVVPRNATSLLVIDTFSLFFSGATVAAGLVVALLARPYLEACEEHREEFYVVLLLAVLGALVLVSGIHFASFFLGLELLTVSLVIMIGYLRASNQSVEAGLKYLILATASSAFMLFGLALLYFEFGSMQFDNIGNALRGGAVNASLPVVTGGALLFVGVGYKLAVAPFHMWTPDIYEGAPAPVTAFVATVPKGAMIAFLYRLLHEAGVITMTPLVVVVSALAVASMFIGNFLALRQDNVKRLLAYSSISHMGYLLVAVVAGGTMATGAVGYYIVAYYITLLAAVGVISLLSDGPTELMDIEDYRGLFWRRPGVATVLAGSMLSLAGIPLTAGFIGKFLVLAAGVGSSLWTLVILLVANSAIGLYYYLRVTVVLFSRRDPEEPVRGARMSFAGGTILAVLGLLMLFLGVYPAPLLWVLRMVGITMQ
jgi:NADH-quinone oxidoreductase subunit N